jgi:predicted NACHT family NTPase
MLVDGVDELSHERRELMLKALQRLMHMYPLARYMITSRPLRVKEQPWEEWEDWLERGDFTRVRLLDMTLPMIDIFVDHWHTALVQACKASERAEVQKLPAMLKTLFRQRPALQNLATNPLICAMICALHYDRRNNLPSKRVALYKACIETLILRDRGCAIDLGGDFAQLDKGIVSVNYSSVG